MGCLKQKKNVFKEGGSMAKLVIMLFRECKGWQFESQL
jgi:hypothetical protein